MKNSWQKEVETKTNSEGMFETKRQKKFPLLKRIFAVIGIFFIFALGVSILLPVPNYYVEGPGGVIPLSSAVKVDGRKDKKKGDFYLTAVSMYRPTVWGLLKASYFSEFEEIVSKKEVMGNSSNQEYWEVQKYYMESSRNAAIDQAAKLANHPSTLTFDGVNVMSVDKKSKFYGKLEVGDLVTGIDGQTFRNSKEMIDYIRSKKIGQKVSVAFERGKKKKQVTEKLIYVKETGASGIGISLVDRTTVKTDVPIDIDAGKVGGPSGGLMFTLETYELLSGKDLRHGKKIAGTGTMEENGTVGRIGGIDKKVVSASEEGIDIFFAPDDEITEKMRKVDPKMISNYQEAKRAADKLGTKMRIVPVKTVQGAVEYLEKLS